MTTVRTAVEVRILPETLGAYAESLGWMKTDALPDLPPPAPAGARGLEDRGRPPRLARGVSMYYVAPPETGLPAIVIPTSDQIGADYGIVIEHLVAVFAAAARKTPGEMLRDLSSVEPRLV